jgi:hypothetical protein
MASLIDIAEPTSEATKPTSDPGGEPSVFP